MVKFGYSEVIHPLSTEKIIAQKVTYRAGEPFNTVEKVSDSHKVINKQGALDYILKAMEQADRGDTDYVCIELFTERGISRVNICHMRQTN